MGEHLDSERFNDEDRDAFRERLGECIERLRTTLAQPGFGVGPRSVGAELELYLVDSDLRPAPINREVLEDAGDSTLTLELNRYNVEFNAPPHPLAGTPFSALRDDLDGAVARLRRVAAKWGADVVAIGILPTLRPEDLAREMMSDKPRYRALSRELRELRGAPFRLSIHGAEELDIEVDDVTAEGAATSFQVHLRVVPDHFRDCYNAAQAVTPAVLGIAGNSPLFLGRNLWDESRIALFKQATDYRPPAGKARLPARVTFGTEWMTGGPADLFRYEVEHFAPLLPIVSGPDEGPGAPAVRELRLHHGTVWRWNRPIYDPAGGGHLRIEFRSLPAGPTSIDMAANAAFAIGLTLGLRERAAEIAARLPFEDCHQNFYRAAQNGPSAALTWPGVGPIEARELALRLLPDARDGLRSAGVDDAECERFLDVIRARAETGRTGARWQRSWLTALDREHGRDRALPLLLAQYQVLAERGRPVHEWPLPG